MEKKEFFDKIDKVREMVNSFNTLGIGGSRLVIQHEVEATLHILGELKNDAEILLQDEYDEGYELGLSRGWNHEDGMSCE